MTTVVDPTGTPTIVFNRSGATIVSAVGGFSQDKSPNPFVPIGNEGVDIPRLSQTTIALLTTSTVLDNGGGVHGWNSVFRLPSDAEIGDIVEAYLVNGGGQGPAIFPQIGERILSEGSPLGAVSDGTNPSAISATNPGVVGRSYRKIASDTWVALGTP